MDLNKVMLIGRVTKEPEVRTLQTGQAVASFSVATNRQWTDASGQKQEKAEFHNIVAWRKLAEIVQSYVKKGMKIYIEGRMETRSWEDPQGQKKYRTEIVCDNMIMLDSKGGSGSAQGSAATPKPVVAGDAPNPAVNTPDEEISIEDIPF
ncbi:MAG: single-stranded DNA-binding protein [Candidatus Kerfeldbacteria bacterium]|nr:single-stranded DNA-binding protein [Candidatus Kerfeldbacteria bacterium]